jgi:hypothetical protein
MMKFLANIALLLVVTIICVALAEAGLRAFTPFPIHGRKANKIYDVDFGYRLNPGHPSSDKYGFRNKGEKERVFAAIGDSHTYGSNVRQEESWPEQFEKITGVPTYNFGVGSYAVYAHYAIARRAIDQGYKHIIIALLIHNDFKVTGNSCDIDYASSQFWQEVKARLSLNLPDCSNAKNWRTAKAPGFIRWFRGRANSAILSAIDYLLVRPVSDQWHRMTVSTSKAKKAPVISSPAKEAPKPAPAREVRKRSASAYFAGRALKNQEVEFAFTDLSRPAVLSGIEDFEKMLVDLKRAAGEKGAKVGLLFIPTKVQLFYEYLDDKDIYEKLRVLKDMAENHIKIENRLADHMTRNGVFWSSAAPELITAIEKSDRDRSWVYAPTGGHPNPPGYRAYAEAAKKLYERMATQ